ncbi:PREDICTED: nicalin-1 [Papilio xuthus]|uniref:BOS complex subunit NCLN n=1 Tax=Papilio xuthus TaxID=66420 RepID=A0AAJ6Z066_PAPXU|nr:PREDICTED: nicalin-1 [Papilio xuthus]
MWLDEVDGFAEIFKGYLPYYLLVALPIFIIMSPVNPVAASHEFSVYRMQQYDLHSVPHGCRSSSFNLEGRSLTSWSTARHCVVARLQDITIEQFMEIRSKSPALLLVLPKNNTELTVEQKEHIQLLEMAMIQQEMLAPVYFAKWSPEFEDILDDLQHSFITDDKSGTFDRLVSIPVVTAPAPQKLDSKPVTLHGKLVGRSEARTIVIAAHYDAAGLVPELAQGADSNASGAVAVLELARIFSRLYSSVAVRGAPSLLFVLTSVGHSLNYFATKKWLEEQLDVTDASLLQDVSFVLCLDSISSENLNLHVSKPPKAGGAAHSLRARLNVPVVHKKINLADELLAWHHERFSIRRMTAFTLSSLQSHKEPARNTILDTPSEESLKHLVNNIKVTARALASHIYNLTDEVNDEDAALYDDALDVDEAAVRHWYEYLSSQPRAPHLITTTPQNSGVTGALEKALSRYVDVTMSTHTVDKREPEYVLYSPLRNLLYVYSVKPAVFDLILTLAIVAYLSLVYFAIQMFPKFYEEYAKFVTGKAKVY